jgi:molybdopterin-guanine dinucleotide biosynthesis protein A
VYSVSVLAAAEAALDGPDRSLRRLIDRSSALRITESEWRAAGISDRFSLNVNTPEDFERVSRERRR